MPVSKIPQDFHTITPSLSVNGAAKAIDLYVQALGAKELYRMASPDSGKIMHACVQIGSSKIFLSDANPEKDCPATTSSFYLYIDDVDAAFKQAKQGGLQETFAVQDMFWGDRMGCVKDSFGNSWTLATHVRDVSPEEMEEGRKNFGKKAA